MIDEARLRGSKAIRPEMDEARAAYRNSRRASIPARERGRLLKRYDLLRTEYKAAVRRETKEEG